MQFKNSVDSAFIPNDGVVKEKKQYYLENIHMAERLGRGGWQATKFGAGCILRVLSRLVHSDLVGWNQDSLKNFLLEVRESTGPCSETMTEALLGRSWFC